MKVAFTCAPSDKEPSPGAPDRKKPLGGIGSGLHLLWFRYRVMFEKLNLEAGFRSELYHREQ